MSTFWQIIISILISIQLAGSLVVATILFIVALQDGWWFSWDLIKPWKWDLGIILRTILVIIVWEIILFL